ncbi:MAG: hypothetical protein QM754_00650 [Tepidisphaeraceae bacterium]
MARLVNNDGTPPAVAGVAAVSLTIYNTTTGQPVSTTSLPPASILADTLATGSEWREDEKGYNVTATLTPDMMPAAANYRVTLTLTATDGTPTPLVWAVQCLPAA